MLAPFTALQSAGIALVLSAVATLANVWLDAHMSAAALAMVYLLAVVASAALLPRWAGVLASVCCVSALNYFFVPPRHTFQVDGAEYLLVLAVLLAVALGLNALIASLRRRSQLAETRQLQAAQLHALSEQLAECPAGADAAARAAVQWMSANLGLACAVFVDTGTPAGVPGAAATPPPVLGCFGVPADPARFHARSAQWAVENRRPLGRGCADWSDLPLWCAPFSRQAPTGAVQLLLPANALPPDRATQLHWLALARQIGLSVERERAAALARDAQDNIRAEGMRNALLSSLSHDLRTPLAGIMGSASTLREQHGQLSPAQRDSLLLNLEHLARDMTLMTDNTLQWARLSQQGGLQKQWESLEEMLGVAVARARRRWQLPLIELRVSPDLPPVQAEAQLLLQVVSNLLDNAARYGQPARGKIVVQAGRSREGAFIAVRDHGPGLPPGDPQALFERFRQGHASGAGRAAGNAMAPKGQGQGLGLGLGLSICQTIVLAHGGHIEARRRSAEDGGGAEFYVELPLRPLLAPSP